MNGQDLINSRRSIYKFTEETVGEDLLNQALIAASNAPCHKHTHPWKFYILGREIRSKLIPTITKLSKIKSEKLNKEELDKIKSDIEEIKLLLKQVIEKSL